MVGTIGSVVEVWCASTRRWVDGYRVVAQQGDGALVLARPDGLQLPVPLPPSMVRPSQGGSPRWVGGSGTRRVARTIR